MSIKVPTAVRLMNPTEYGIVERVFGDTLPYRARIVITNGAGLENRPFTIPTSLVRTILGSAAVPFLAPVTAFFGYLTSFVNLGYLINVGSAYADMSSRNADLLVHETAHVWQGKNSLLSQSYVYNSAINQCVRGDSAYDYTAGSNWHAYNAEQQAQIVEHWFEAGEPTSGDLWPYIQDHIRKGDA